MIPGDAPKEKLANSPSPTDRSGDPLTNTRPSPHLQVFPPGLEVLGPEGQRLLLQSVGRLHDGGAGGDRTPAGQGSDAVRDLPGVPRDHGDILGGNPKRVRRDLGEYRLVALALGTGSGRDNHPAVGFHPDPGPFERPSTGLFHIEGKSGTGEGL